MIGSIATYKSRLEQKKGYIHSLEKQVATLNSSLATIDNNMQYAEQALAITQEVARQTQSQIKLHIEDIISMALEYILDDPYTFELDFVVKRNKTECDIYFIRDGKRIKPIDQSGGGAVDIASFASRIALWSLGDTDNVLIFDEPFKFVSREYQLKVGELLKKLSDQLGLQILMVSHNSNFIQQSDNIIEIYKEQNVSKQRRADA
jgi:DNA repair exonuclease SbcCD ATPase subunit